MVIDCSSELRMQQQELCGLCKLLQLWKDDASDEARQSERVFAVDVMGKKAKVRVMV